MVGEKFGKLTVLQLLPEDKEEYGKYSGKRVLVQCECGIVKSANMRSVSRGRTTSCGCARIDKITKHGYSRDRIYSVYRSMLQRCSDKKHWLYPRYGGRGISVCDEWVNDISAFVKWANENGYRPGVTIDRVENNDGYSPDNCRFVTKKENCNNTSKTVFLHIGGEKISLQDAAIKYDIYPSTIYQRIKKLKWTDEDAVKIKPGVQQ